MSLLFLVRLTIESWIMFHVKLLNFQVLLLLLILQLWFSVNWLQYIDSNILSLSDDVTLSGRESFEALNVVWALSIASYLIPELSGSIAWKLRVLFVFCLLTPQSFSNNLKYFKYFTHVNSILLYITSLLGDSFRWNCWFYIHDEI